MDAPESSSPWLAPGRATPLRAWSHAQVQALQDALGVAWTAWALDWGRQDHRSPVRLARDVPAGEGWVRCRDRRDGASLCLRRAADRDPSDFAIFGAAPSPVGDRVLTSSRVDLLERLAGVFHFESTGEEPCALPIMTQGQWTGASVFDIEGDSMLVVDARAMRRFIGPSSAATVGVQPLCHVADAIGDTSMVFTLELEGCELPVEGLLRLVPGDVVCLPHEIEAPARLCDGAGRPCVMADLRRRGAMRAVALRGLAPASAAISFPEEHHA